jgi:hypothetical protein
MILDFDLGAVKMNLDFLLDCDILSLKGGDVMPKRPVEGTAQVNAELPVELLDELKRFAASRGETVRAVILMALRRHMANPPPPPVPTPLPPLIPLPPVPGVDEPIKKQKKGRK